MQPESLNLVFGALADPSRRQVIGYLSARGTATATELTGELPMTRQAVVEAPGDARGRRPRRVGAPGPRDAVPPDRVPAQEWDDRLDALAQHLERRKA